MERHDYVGQAALVKSRSVGGRPCSFTLEWRSRQWMMRVTTGDKTPNGNPHRPRIHLDRPDLKNTPEDRAIAHRIAQLLAEDMQKNAPIAPQLAEPTIGKDECTRSPATPTPMTLLTIPEAAARVHATVKQIRRRIQAGLLPAVRPPGARSYLVRAEDVDCLYSPVLTTPKPKERETETQYFDRLLAKSGLR